MLLIPFVLLSLFCVCVNKYLFNKLRSVSKVNSFHRHLPRLQWTFLNIPILDGIITVIKFRKGGTNLWEQLVTKYGSNFRCCIGTVNLITISDPHILQKVLQSTNTGHLSKPRTLYEFVFPPLLQNGLFVSDAKIWSPHRKAISRAFTSKSFPTYVKIINDGVKAMVKTACSTALSSDGIIYNEQFKELVEFHAIKLNAGIISGSDNLNISDSEFDQFNQSFTKWKQIMVHRSLHPELTFPFIWNLHRNKREVDRVMENIRKFAYNIINKYRMTASQDAINQNKITNLPSANNCDDESLGVKPFQNLIEHMQSKEQTTEEISHEISTILVAGRDSIGKALDFMLLHLASNPEHLQKCQTEIDELLESDIGFEVNGFTMESLSELQYLERCILETLRLTPPIPFFGRRLDTPLQISDDCIIEAGQNILIPPWSLHRRPEFYPNPEKFDPDRFLPENVKQRHSHSFIPFSMGTRNCLGSKIAILELKVLAAYTLRHFDISTTDRLSDLNFLFDLTLKPERPINLVFKLR